MTQQKKQLTASSKSEINAFIDKLERTPLISTGGRGRLIFSLDATASRQPTWDHACHLQSEMFSSAASLGSLQIQLCYFRGFRDFSCSDWLSSSDALLQQMNRVRCAAGHTQISRVLRQAIQETRQQQVQAVVYIGDCMEESLDHLCGLAGELGLLSTPLFIFQEGHDAVARHAMQEMARLSGGAYLSFDQSSAGELRTLLQAVAVFATGGKKALQHFSQNKQGLVLRLTQQLK